MSVQSAVRSLLDTALDRTIIGGYACIGYRLRRFGWADDPEHYLPLTRYGDREREFVWRYCAEAIGIENP